MSTNLSATITTTTTDDDELIPKGESVPLSAVTSHSVSDCFSPVPEAITGNDSNVAVETVSTDSKDSKSRPLKIVLGSSVRDCEESQSISQQQVDLSAPASRGQTPRKSDSLDSAQAACCSKLAFNLYSKALESAKKALPRQRTVGNKNRFSQFPRSFGENFGSLGPDGFYYLDDTQTECSGDYRDIEFNRDSYLFNGSEVIAELSEDEDSHLMSLQMMDPSNNLEQTVLSSAGDEYPNIDSVQGNLSNLQEENTLDFDHEPELDPNKPLPETPSSKPKTSFIGRIFKSRQSDESKKSHGKKGRKGSGTKSDKNSRSVSRECSREKSVPLRGESLPPGPTRGEKYLIESLEQQQSEHKRSSSQKSVNDDTVILSNVSRQSPVHLVYGKPPDIFVEECTTLPREIAANEMARRTSQVILDDVLNAISSGDPTAQVQYANQPLFVADTETNAQSGQPEQVEPKKKSSKPRFFANKFKFGSSKNKPSKTANVEEKDISPVKVDEPVESMLSSMELNTCESTWPEQEIVAEREQLSTGGHDSVPSVDTEVDVPPVEPVASETSDHTVKSGGKGFFANKKEKFSNKVNKMKNKNKSKASTDAKKEKIEKKFFAKNVFHLKSKESAQNDEQLPTFPKSQLPKLPDSRNSTLSGHVYEGINDEHVPVDTVNDQPMVTEQIDTNKPDFAVQYSSIQITEPVEIVISPSVDTSNFASCESQDVPMFENIENVKEIGVTYEPSLADKMDTEPDVDQNEPTPGKVAKIKNMMGSFGQSFRSKMKDLIKKPEQESGEPPIESEVVEDVVELKETNLDEVIYEEGVRAASIEHDGPAVINITSMTEETMPSVYRVDVTLDDHHDEYEDEAAMEGQQHNDDNENLVGKKKKIKRKLKKTDKQDDKENEDTATWSSKSRTRLARFKSRAAESLNQFADKIKQQKKSFKSKNSADKPPRQTTSVDMYEYDLKFSSDSELAPGSGVDSLRRSKVYQELADAQERLELYMSPVRSGPLRPPRGKPPCSDPNDQIYNQSMPSLSLMNGRNVPRGPPPRPPPPKFYCSSVPAISLPDDEISLSTSMSSLWTRRKHQGRQSMRRQRVPAEMFYRNVRLGYRPKKSYMEMLQKSNQTYYSMATLAQQNKSQSMGALGGQPVAPARKARMLYASKGIDTRSVTTSPPPPNSRASLSSNYDQLGHNGRFDPTEQEMYNLYEQTKFSSPNPYELSNVDNLQSKDPSGRDPLMWQPFTWKVKRCRSLTEIDVRQRSKRPCSVDRQCSQSPTTTEYERQQSQTPTPFTEVDLNSTPLDGPGHETRTTNVQIPQRIFSWLASTTSLDTWRANRQKKHDPKSKPPRPPPPLPLRTQSKVSSSDCSPLSKSPIVGGVEDDIVVVAQCFPTESCHITPTNAFAVHSVYSDTGFAKRPLPPPPVPPRPKLIPAHYAQRSTSPVEKRDCAVDTSENGFLAYHCSEKEVQVKLPTRQDSASTTISSLDSDTLLCIDAGTVAAAGRRFASPVTPVPDDEDEVTIVEDRRQSLDQCLLANDKETDFSDHTAASLYLDALSRLTGTTTNTHTITDGDTKPKQFNQAHHQSRPHFGSDWSDDDDTINDDLSSLSSNYQSVCEQPPSVSSSWLHGRGPLAVDETSINQTPANTVDCSTATTTTGTANYHTAMEDIKPEHDQALSNRSSIISSEIYDELEANNDVACDSDYEQFRQAFVSSHHNEENEQQNGADGPQPEQVNCTGPNSHTGQQTDSINNRQSCISTESSESTVSCSSSGSSLYTYTTKRSSGLSKLSTPPPSDTTANSSRPESDECDSFQKWVCLGQTSGDSDEGLAGGGGSDQVQQSSPVVSNVTEPNPMDPAQSPSSAPLVRLPAPKSTLPSTTPKGAKPDKLYYSAHELYTTERDYVDALNMLTVDFREAIAPHVTANFLDEFFRPLDLVKPINQRLLQELSKRVLEDWDDNPKVSDIMIDICPYLKEYSIFIREFNRLNFMLDQAKHLFPNFSDALRKFQHSERCRKLAIKSYLLKPVQRLPQYRLLLVNYLGKLPSDHPNRTETENAVQIVSNVAEHLNRESYLAANMDELAYLKNRIICPSPDSIMAPGRVLLKHGVMHKVSRKEFNDSLFYLMPVMNGMLRLKEEFPLEQVQVKIQPEYQNEFIVSSVKRSFALLAKNTEEREKWVQALKEAIEENQKKRNSFETARNSTYSIASSIGGGSIKDGSTLGRTNSQMSQNSDNSFATTTTTTSSIVSSMSGVSINEPGESEPESVGLGERAPVWVHDHRVTMCQRCTKEFNLLTRRHHCRACGRVVCSECSPYNYPLKYLNNDSARVCFLCYEVLCNSSGPVSSVESNARASKTSANSSSEKSLSRFMVPSIDVDDSGVTLADSKHTEDNATDQNKSTGAETTSDRVASKSLNVCDQQSLAGIKNRSNSCSELTLRTWSESSDVVASSSSSSILPPLIRNQNIRHSSRMRKNFSSVLVEIAANDPHALISGYLHRLSGTKRTWKRYWFVVKQMVLYTFKASEDVRAVQTLPLPGFHVSVAEAAIKGVPANLIICLKHPCQSTINFYAENSEQHSRWLNAFRECATLQPQPTQPLSKLSGNKWGKK